MRLHQLCWDHLSEPDQHQAVAQCPTICSWVWVQLNDLRSCIASLFMQSDMTCYLVCLEFHVAVKHSSFLPSQTVPNLKLLTITPRPRSTHRLALFSTCHGPLILIVCLCPSRYSANGAVHPKDVELAHGRAGHSRDGEMWEASTVFPSQRWWKWDRANVECFYNHSVPLRSRTTKSDGEAACGVILRRCSGHLRRWGLEQAAAAKLPSQQSHCLLPLGDYIEENNWTYLRVD